MLLIAESYMRCGRNLRAKFYTAINSLSANHASLKTLYNVKLHYVLSQILTLITVQGSECTYERGRA